MPKHPAHLFLAVVGVVSLQAALGCSHDPPPPPLASKSDVMQSNLTKAKQFLDVLQHMDPGERKSAANSPRMATTLRTASSDPEIKKRMVALGVDVK
jgi:hypothetical protein